MGTLSKRLCIGMQVNEFSLRIRRFRTVIISSAVAGAECNTVIELKLEHHAA